MKLAVFDVSGTLAHFRRPDTTTTHLTYPFIGPTAAKGLVGAVLGIEDFVSNDKVGIQLLSPVRTVAQQLSMLGKDSGSSSFNRPTTIELLVNPAYRIYYGGREYVDELAEFLQQQKAVYHTYLGTAYALTKPILVEVIEKASVITEYQNLLKVQSVVPSRIIDELDFSEERHYSRAGGYMYQYKGQRTFEKSIDYIFERRCKSISFVPKADFMDSGYSIIKNGEKTVCLV